MRSIVLELELIIDLLGRRIPVQVTDVDYK